MISTFNEAVTAVFAHEGWDTITDDATDRGGLTKFGISKRAFPDIDIANLTLEDAKEIYRNQYWLKARCDELPTTIRYAHFNACVNIGVKSAIKVLQRASGLTGRDIDGDFGPQTRRVSQNCTVLKYCRRWMHRYARIVKANSSQSKYIKGWLNRIFDVLETYNQ